MTDHFWRDSYILVSRVSHIPTGNKLARETTYWPCDTSASPRSDLHGTRLSHLQWFGTAAKSKTKRSKFTIYYRDFMRLSAKVCEIGELRVISHVFIRWPGGGDSPYSR